MKKFNGNAKPASEEKKVNKYTPNLIRTDPFKWIYFPIFLVIWFILYWFVFSPIVWSRYLMKSKNSKWPAAWPYLFWSVAAIIFCIILIILVAIWRWLTPSEQVYVSKSEYDKVFLNPEHGDEKEVLCNECLTFHVPGPKFCKRQTEQDKCPRCGNVRESYNKCCVDAIQLEKNAPSYDIVIEKQQPDIVQRRKSRHSHENKRNSLKSVRSRNSSSSSSVVISMHDMGTKSIINKNIALHKAYDQNIPSPSSEQTNAISDDLKQAKTKKPINLAPVDVDLANRYSSVEFFGDKIPLKSDQEIQKTVPIKENIEAERQSTTLTPPSVSSMDSMNKQKFKDYLHLVDVMSPSTPSQNQTDENTVVDIHQPPLSPREIFFYDLIQASAKSESPDSTHYGMYKFEKKRPTSHILMTSDVGEKLTQKRRKVSENDCLERQADKYEVSDKKSFAINSETPELQSKKTNKSTTLVKIIYTTKKGSFAGTPTSQSSSDEMKSLSPKSNQSSLSEQMSIHESNNLRNQSSKFFISDIQHSKKSPKDESSRNRGDFKRGTSEECDEVFDEK